MIRACNSLLSLMWTVQQSDRPSGRPRAKRQDSQHAPLYKARSWGEPHARMRARKNVVGLVLSSLVVALGLSVLTVTPAAAADVISFRASAQSAATQTTHRVTIPTTVRETDALLLFVTGNRANPVAATPPGGPGSEASWTPTRRPSCTARWRQPTTPGVARPSSSPRPPRPP